MKKGRRCQLRAGDIRVQHRQPRDIDTLLAVRAKGRLLIGRERIALLEAVMEHKSITKAAEVAGFSYKTAWDAVNAINNLLPRPAFLTRTGGSHGGGAEITDEGRRLIRAFRRLEEKLGRISTAIAEEGLEHEEDLLFWGLGLKLSARNAFFCKVVKIIPARVDVEVKLEVSSGLLITASVTNASVRELGLAPGRQCVAVVNASSILIAQSESARRISARNKIQGTVIGRTDDKTVSEIVMDIGGGKTMTAVVSPKGADEAEAAIGAQVLAVFKASHVILAAD
jgi:molybdate transport system regulatory protein